MPPGNQAPNVDQCYCFAIRRASRQISRFYDSYLQPTGLRTTQFLVLMMLNEMAGATISDFADRLDVEQTAMGKMVGTLQREGLVSIRRSPSDGRNRIVQLTNEGRAAFDRAAPLWQEAQRRFRETNDVEKITALRPGFMLPDAANKVATSHLTSGG